MEEVKEHADSNIVIMLVGNKADLCERHSGVRRVPVECAVQFAKENGVLFQETSAVTIMNVREAFEALLQAVYIMKNKAKSVRAVKETILLKKDVGSHRSCYS